MTGSFSEDRDGKCTDADTVQGNGGVDHVSECPDAKSVDCSVRKEDDSVDTDRLASARHIAVAQLRRGGDEVGKTEIDGGGNSDLTDEVEPTGDPGKERSAVLRSEHVSPEVRASRRWY